jgi:hypothetical protein
VSSRMNRPLRGASMSSRAIINLALDTHVALRGASEHDVLNELINAVRDSAWDPRDLAPCGFIAGGPATVAEAAGGVGVCPKPDQRCGGFNVQPVGKVS